VSERSDADLVAKQTFVITLVGAVLFCAAIFLFIL
jgi:hypothetical protein